MRAQRRSAGRLAGQAGFTLLELVVVICIVAFGATALLDRLWRYQEMAEKAGMEYTMTIVRTALTLETAHALVKGGGRDLDRMAQANPMSWMSTLPPTYVGEFDGPAPAGTNGWYYDRSSRQLVYLPKRSDYLEPMADGTKAIRLKVQRAPASGPGAGRDDPSQRTPTLALVQPYRWFEN